MAIGTVKAGTRIKGESERALVGTSVLTTWIDHENAKTPIEMATTKSAIPT